ncbi:hypothetical protein H5410_035510 [Solanum commersonii]|uniref:Uncharacterized protein n=1 Tax=Solanum commersonii TaxID=4109 RepID=A0A9J5Y5D1_SOLCO|nr:hypothetical protein H5410_035510 [Solanum commersonii]
MEPALARLMNISGNLISNICSKMSDTFYVGDGWVSFRSPRLIPRDTCPLPPGIGIRYLCSPRLGQKA